MELTAIEKIVLESIFIDPPLSQSVVESIHAFARSMGRPWTGIELHQTLEKLISKQLVILITPDIAAKTMDNLDDTHGPLLTLETSPHYSVTTAGGKARLAYCPHEDGEGLGGYGVISIQHYQFFTPSAFLADKLIATSLFSANKLAISNVYLTPSFEDENGYLLDIHISPSSPINNPYVLINEQKPLTQSDLQLLMKQNNYTNNMGLSSGEIIALLELSGIQTCYVSYEDQQTAFQALFKKDLIRELQKSEVIRQRQRLATNKPLLFGPVPRTKMQVLTDHGKAALLDIVNALPSIRNYLCASRIVGEYVTRYYTNIDQANEAHAKLSKAGRSVSSIESIGKWCYYWWDVHLEGARFEYWNDNQS